MMFGFACFIFNPFDFYVTSYFARIVKHMLALLNGSILGTVNTYDVGCSLLNSQII